MSEYEDFEEELPFGGFNPEPDATDGFAAARRESHRVRYEERVARMNRFIKLTEEGMPLREVCETIGMSIETYRNWRQRHEDFLNRFLEAQQKARNRVVEYDETFVSFREVYLGMRTTAFQRRMVDAIERARPGEVTLILIPPEHGKTTLLEDWCTYKLVTDRSFRITVASETVDHGMKVLGRVQERFEPDGPTPHIVRDFGRMRPDDREAPWGAKRFNVEGKGASDERDYSMSCVGITGRVQGTRCDLLLLDDIQDVKSIEQSDKYFKIIRQSFLSRPSMFGRTVIIGTRVDEWDVYRALLDSQLVDHLVTIPAHSEANSTVAWNFDPTKKPDQDDPSTWAPEGVSFLWPDKYDAQEPGEPPVDDLHRYRYAALRFRVGETSWWRIYQQRPERASKMTFSEEVTTFTHDTTRSIYGDPHGREDGPAKVCISLDPAIGGGNGVLAAAHYKDRMDVLDCELRYDLTSNREIVQVLENFCARWHDDETMIVYMIVIEDKAFQKGLLRDDGLLELQTKYGFRIAPNTTGKEKTDKDIGVPAMPTSMIRREITIPMADPDSVERMRPLFDHLHSWKPGVPGNKLAQDMVMALWFNYRKWRTDRDTPVHPQSSRDNWRGRGSPLRSPGPRRKRRPYRSAVQSRRQNGRR